jgi:Lon protease-like protein
MLPLFPLPLVMLPGELVPLHIFEPRYRQMLDDIMSTDNLFALVYHDPQNAFDGPQPGSYGCIAKVHDVDSLPDGRSNILCIGAIRLELREVIDSVQPYFVGRVNTFTDEPQLGGESERLSDEVFDLFNRTARAAHESAGFATKLPELEKTDPEALSFLVAAALNFEIDKKLDLALMRSTTMRLERLKASLSEAVEKAEKIAGITKTAKTNGHGGGGLDLSGVK